MDKLVVHAIGILKGAIANIEERSQSYNGNGIGYEDYKLNGIESVLEDVMESLVRFWNEGSADKAEDATAYMALACAFIQFGMPQSKFSPIFKQFIPILYRIEKAEAKANQERAQRIAACN